MRGRGLAIVAVVALLVGVIAALGLGTAAAWEPGPNGWGRGGMMGGYGQGMMGTWSGQSQGEPIGLDQALKNVQAYVAQTGNGDLVVDEMMEFQHNYYAIVKEKSTGRGAFELLVNKATGAVFPEMGPNMMWNTKYGMHSSGGTGGFGGMMGQGMMGGGFGGMMGGQYPVAPPTGPMTVTPEQATATAQKWLDQYQSGSTTEHPDEFYGYYTLHTVKDGKVAGMLSVNGYTGQVWYHSWHGDFVQLKEIGE